MVDRALHCHSLDTTETQLLLEILHLGAAQELKTRGSKRTSHTMNAIILTRLIVFKF